MLGCFIFWAEHPTNNVFFSYSLSVRTVIIDIEGFFFYVNQIKITSYNRDKHLYLAI